MAVCDKSVVIAIDARSFIKDNQWTSGWARL